MMIWKTNATIARYDVKILILVNTNIRKLICLLRFHAGFRFHRFTFFTKPIFMSFDNKIYILLDKDIGYFLLQKLWGETRNSYAR